MSRVAKRHVDRSYGREEPSGKTARLNRLYLRSKVFLATKLSFALRIRRTTQEWSSFWSEEARGDRADQSGGDRVICFSENLLSRASISGALVFGLT